MGESGHERYGFLRTSGKGKLSRGDDGKFKDDLNLQWIIIFDRIDTFFLILFNAVNVLMSIILLF